MKAKNTSEAQLLEVVKKALFATTDDPKLADKIYSAIQQELAMKARAKAFDKFCSQCKLPNLDASSVLEVKQQLAESFAEGDVTIKPNKKEQALMVEVSLPDGHQFASEIKVKTEEETEEDDSPKKMVPFPVSLPGDPELVWFLAKHETTTPEEAAMALARAEDAFWGSKAGQKLQRDHVEKCFPEFMQRAPASVLSEVGLKRVYREPEAIKVLRPIPQATNSKKQKE